MVCIIFDLRRAAFVRNWNFVARFSTAAGRLDVRFLALGPKPFLLASSSNFEAEAIPMRRQVSSSAMRMILDGILGLCPGKFRFPQEK
jgi:hypothetical protein